MGSNDCHPRGSFVYRPSNPVLSSPSSWTTVSDDWRSTKLMTDWLQWTFNDRWILMSVYLTQGEDGASLHDVVGAADAMNHAIPTCGELSRALTRLASCGVLTERDDQFHIVHQYLIQ